mgnify:CR=1 FL=1
MTNKSKIKGTVFERECVWRLIEFGFKSVQRAWGSDGRSLLKPSDVDIVADDLLIQCKRRKTVPKWLNLGNCDMVMFRGDHGETMVAMRLDYYAERTKYDRVDIGAD